MNNTRYGNIIKVAGDPFLKMASDVKMALEGMDAVLTALNQPCYFVSFFALFVTFVHNVAATISYERK
jgi:hypothetical protein